MVAGQGGAVVQNSDVEIKLRGERRDSLRDMARPGNPKSARRSNGLAIEPVGGSRNCALDNAKIFFHAPGESCLPRGESGPKFRANSGCIRQNKPENLPSADQAIVPAEIMVQQKVKRGGLAGAEGLNGALLDFGSQAAAAERDQDAAIGIKQPFRAHCLRAGPFRQADEAQGGRLTAPRGFGAPAALGIISAVK